MSDRHAGYIVALAADIREDDATDLIKAIEMLRGVAKVTPLISDPALFIARQRAKQEMSTRLWQALEEPQP